MIMKTLEVPELQWAQQYKKTETELVQIPVPQVLPDTVLVQIKFSGVCRSDMHACKGHFPEPAKHNIVGGHEGAGVIVACGKNVSQLSMGDRVGVQWVNGACGECEFCLNNQQQLCPQLMMSGYTVDGTFQQFCLCKATNVVRIPDEIPLEEAAPLMCAGVTVYNAIKAASIQPGQILTVAGAGGGLGNLACQYAKALGYRVLAISTGSIKKQILLEDMGVDFFVDYSISPDKLPAEIRRVTSGGPHVVIVVASNERSLNQAVEYVRSNGTVVAVGLHKTALLKTDLNSFVFRKIVVKGVYVGTRVDTEEALQVYAQHRLHLHYQLRDLQDLGEVFEQMDQGTMVGRTVLAIPDVEHAEQKFSKAEYNIGTFLAHRLEEIGVKHYFVVPGDFNLTLLDQILTNTKLQMVGCCSELNVGYAADGYARSSPDRVAVVFVTFMVGGLSVINAIAGAYSEHLRVIVVSGAPPSQTFGEDRILHHTIGLKHRDRALEAFRPVTTAAVRLETKEDPTTILDKALTKCLDDSLPVYIEIPCDLPKALCAPPMPLPARQVLQTQPGVILDALNLFRRHWRAARRPVIIVGALARYLLPITVLVSFLEKLGCSVFCQPDGKSLVPESHLLFQGTLWGTSSEKWAWKTARESDLWVVLGGRWSDFHGPRGSHMLEIGPNDIQAPDETRILGISMAEMATAIIQSDLSICPSNQIINGVHKSKSPSKTHGLTNEPLNLQGIIAGIESVLQPGDTLVAETGDSWFNSQKVKLPVGADYQMQLIYGSIGWSLPATLGTQLARPQGRIILMIGDGSFQMTAQELSTLIRLKTNPIIFIFNNLGYRIESAIHDGPYNYVTNWNYAQLAQALCPTSHCPGDGNKFLTDQGRRDQEELTIITMRIRTHDDLLLALRRVCNAPEKLAVLECCIHPWDISENMVRFCKGISKQ